MRDPLGRDDSQYNVTINVPLGNSAHAPNFNLNLAHSATGGTQEQAMLNGSAGADNQSNYGATAARNSGGSGSSGALNGGYRSPYAVLNVGVGSGSGYSQASLGVSGAVVAHPGGITFGQPMGDTIGVVCARRQRRPFEQCRWRTH